ncbi:MAG: triose-phosphate isomerase [Gammaproteobacteria bacterium]|jgi:triosephosphate isomerase|nr:triose-phosphate isomerase [Gammaproteobacteria bacterium]MBT3719449.1 triose-phosphate isomerase [Gammaproteobacteria bacterium]MBT3845606.1 triose-phosphate isomerase [Gammaproteobacteria bacterium]MBT3894136.1 triose-phosphate isomerase [Gammaproteobacteria bacterium]MBT4301664.1 triose-phosphate isomerase [Gammaproteobacteria bacterium]
MRKPIVAGNWKMNGTLESIRELVAGLKAGIGEVNVAEVVVCAPAIYIAEASALTGGTAIALGSQDLSNAASGAYTGEISGSMLNDFNCQYAIVGHSERRHGRGESDQLVAEKFKAAQDSGLTPILCIGELLEEREEGVTEQVCARQMDAVINAYGVAALQNSVIAYEPVWAIGTGKTASPEQAQEVHAFVRSHIAKQDQLVADGVRIQYGGSMNAANAAELLAQPDIDGGLIGGASLKSEDFLTICRAAG